MIELKESAELLGFEIVDWVSNTWGDGPWLGRRWEDPSMQMTGLIEQALEMTAAETVVLPGVNTHQEHRLVRDATLAALRPSANSGRHRPRYVLSAESPTDSWAREPDGRFWVELDRSDVDRKLAAIYLHESQRREGLTERSTFVLQALAQLRGAEAGVPRAERYRVERILL